jgi:hypothetical protein
MWMGFADQQTSGSGPAAACTFAGNASAQLTTAQPGDYTMRRNQAAPNLQTEFLVDPLDNGLERFLTSTRRQNFLCPLRRHRAFPLVELA